MTVVVALAMLALYGRHAGAKLVGIGRPGIVAGLLMGSTFVLFVFVLQHTSIAHAIVLIDTAPLIAGILAWIWLGERVRASGWLCLILAVVGNGIMVLGKAGRATLLGDALALVVAAAFALYIVLLRRHRAIDLLPAVLIAGAAACVPAALLAPALWLPNTPSLWFGLLSGVALASGTLLFAAAAGHLPAAQSGLIVLLEVVPAVLWAWLILDERPSGFELFGGLAVLTALAMDQVMRRATVKPEP